MILLQDFACNNQRIIVIKSTSISIACDVCVWCLSREDHYALESLGIYVLILSIFKLLLAVRLPGKATISATLSTFVLLVSTGIGSPMVLIPSIMCCHDIEKWGGYTCKKKRDFSSHFTSSLFILLSASRLAIPYSYLH